MALDHNDIERVAHLARLEIDASSVPGYVESLSDIIQLVTQLGNADTADVVPMAHPFDAVQRLRQDVVTEVDQRDKFQAVAPQTEAGLYLVPKVID